ncbi:MAG: glycoside hydrolase family 15 protein, partial [Bdellovibrionota bacterium]
MGYLLLSDYGLVGNQSSAALISRLGSVDWLCLPWLDSPSHFAALQDEDQGGRFQIMPQGEFRSHQRYLQRTQILETTFETPHGSAVLRDWMPVTEVFAAEPVLCRELEMLHGQIPWLLTCVPRFAGGGTPATAEKIDRGVLFRGSVLGDLARLETDLSLDIPPSGGAALARFDLAGGESANFCWSWGRREALTKFPLWRDCATAWHTWAHRCPPEGCLLSGPWHDLAARSGLVLKILSNRYAGSLSEAVITPRPSTRSAWIRDCALATLGLHRLGHEAEAGSSFGWLMQLLERDGAEGLQTTYTLDGGKFADGGAGFQLETYGQILLACERILGAQSQLPPGLWVQLASILDHVCQVWRRPDFAPWLLQSKAEHFVASKFFCWVALDRGIKIAHRLREPVPRRWSTELGILRKTILEQGFDRAQGTFVRSFGDRGV